MPFEKGNKLGITSGGGGRMSKRDESLRELVVEKAMGKYLKALTRLGDDKGKGMTDKQVQRIKDLCLPVVVKDMANKIANPDGSKIEQVLVRFLDAKDDKHTK